MSHGSEAGLLGFVLKYNFKDSHEAYAYYTYDQNEEAFKEW
ncbi:hypothetical protein [Psychrobacillus sp. NEAU-3TGS]|nr:hypothetical protein [Psychrobacillus sp. NEAU-3TGS]